MKQANKRAGTGIDNCKVDFTMDGEEMEQDREQTRGNWP